MVISANDLRLEFSSRLSEMYKKEVPAYGTLISLVQQVNGSQERRISRERHGAIRVGLPHELRFMSRLFAVYGMFPVQYYDLSVAGIPVHSTAFRPIHASDLEICPFRVFTSLLRTDFLHDISIKNQVIDILKSRHFVPQELSELLEKAERDKALLAKDAHEFIELSLQIFAFHRHATTDYATYELFKKTHPLIADIVCFKTPHINHLTPRTLDIDLVQKLMPTYGMIAKAVIEGPPLRNIPILLRQTSFKALSEDVIFQCGTSEKHTARFGEIEQRGFALTSKGRKLYDILIADVSRKITPSADGTNADEYYSVLEDIFQQFPDNLTEMINQDLLILDKNGDPQIYEDFLPVNAAGIFTSNLGDTITHHHAEGNFDQFCQELGQIPQTHFMG